MFINQIVWYINRALKNHCNIRTCHDIILYYSISGIYNKVYQPYQKETYKKQIKIKGKARSDELQKLGSEIGDVWKGNVGEDTPSLYPTQKKKRMLKRIICLSTR